MLLQDDEVKAALLIIIVITCLSLPTSQRLLTVRSENEKTTFSVAALLYWLY